MFVGNEICLLQYPRTTYAQKEKACHLWPYSFAHNAFAKTTPKPPKGVLKNKAQNNYHKGKGCGKNNCPAPAKGFLLKKLQNVFLLSFLESWGEFSYSIKIFGG